MHQEGVDPTPYPAGANDATLFSDYCAIIIAQDINGNNPLTNKSTKKSNAINFRLKKIYSMNHNYWRKFMIMKQDTDSNIKAKMETYDFSYGSIIFTGVKANTNPGATHKIQLKVTKKMDVQTNLTTQRVIVKTFNIFVYDNPFLKQNISFKQKTIEVLHGGWTNLEIGPTTYNANNAGIDLGGLDSKFKRILNSIGVNVKLKEWEKETTFVGDSFTLDKQQANQTFAKIIKGYGLVLGIQGKWRIYRLNFFNKSFDQATNQYTINATEVWRLNTSATSTTTIDNKSILVETVLISEFVIVLLYKQVVVETGKPNKEDYYIQFIFTNGSKLDQNPDTIPIVNDILTTPATSDRYKLTNYNSKGGILLYPIGDDLRIIYCRDRVDSQNKIKEDNTTLYTMFFKHVIKDVQEVKKITYNLQVDNEFKDRGLIYSGTDQQISIMQLKRIYGDTNSFMFSYKDMKITGDHPYFIASVNSLFDTTKHTDPGFLLLKQKIQLKTIKKTGNIKIDFSFCPMNQEILIADKTQYTAPTPPPSSGSVTTIVRSPDKRVYSFPYLKIASSGYPLHTKIDVVNVYSFESIFFNDKEGTIGNKYIKDLKCDNLVNGFQILAADKIDTKNNKLISYQIENMFHDPMDRLESVQDVDSTHDTISIWGFPETGILWTVTSNSQIGSNPGHYFSQKVVGGETKSQPIKLWVNYMKGSQVEYESPYNKNDYDMQITLQQRKRTQNLPANTKVEDDTLVTMKQVSQKVKVIVKQADDQPHLALNIQCMLNLNDVNAFLSYAIPSVMETKDVHLTYYREYIETTSQAIEGNSYINISPYGNCIDKITRATKNPDGTSVAYFYNKKHYFRSRILKISKISENESAREYQYCSYKSKGTTDPFKDNTLLDSVIVKNLEDGGLKMDKTNPINNDCALQIYDHIHFKKEILKEYEQPKSKNKITIDGFVKANSWMGTLHSNGNVVIMQYMEDETKMGKIDNSLNINGFKTKYISMFTLSETYIVTEEPKKPSDPKKGEKATRVWIIVILLIDNEEGDVIQFLKFNELATGPFLEVPTAPTETEALAKHKARYENVLNKVEVREYKTKESFYKLSASNCKTHKEGENIQVPTVFVTVLNSVRSKYSLMTLKPNFKIFSESSIEFVTENLPNDVLDFSGICLIGPQWTRYYGVILHPIVETITLFWMDNSKNKDAKIQIIDFFPEQDQLYPLRISCMDPRIEYNYWKDNRLKSSFFLTSKNSEEWSKFNKPEAFFEEFSKNPYMNCFIAFSGIKDHRIRLNLEIGNNENDVIKKFEVMNASIPKIMNFQARNVKSHYPFVFVTGENLKQENFGQRSYYTVIYSLLDFNVKGIVKLSSIDSQNSEKLSIASTLRTLVIKDGGKTYKDSNGKTINTARRILQNSGSNSTAQPIQTPKGKLTLDTTLTFLQLQDLLKIRSVTK